MQGKKGWLIGVSVGVMVLLVAFFWALPTNAATFRSEGTIVIGPDQVLDDDLYAIGQSVLIQGRVTGDVYVLTQRLIISGQVDGDVVAAAQTISISGRVGDDVRVMGQVIQVSGAGVGDDMIAMGASVELAENTPVGGDFIAGGYQIFVGGTVNGNALLGASGVEISGHIKGNVHASVGEGQRTVPPSVFMRPSGVSVPVVPLGLTVTETAVIEGQLQYQSVNDAHIASGAQIRGGVKHLFPSRPERPKPKKRFGTLPWVLDQVRRLISLLAMGLLLFLVYPSGMRTLGRRIHDKPVASFGWGVVAFFGLIALLLVILFAALIVGVLLSVVTLGMLARWVFLLGILGDIFLVAAYFFYVTFVVPVVVPYASMARLDRGRFWWLVPVVIGIPVYVVLTALPYVGGILNILFILLGLGALMLHWRLNGSGAGGAGEESPQETPPEETPVMTEPSETL